MGSCLPAGDVNCNFHVQASPEVTAHTQARLDIGCGLAAYTAHTVVHPDTSRSVRAVCSHQHYYVT